LLLRRVLSELLLLKLVLLLLHELALLALEARLQLLLQRHHFLVERVVAARLDACHHLLGVAERLATTDENLVLGLDGRLDESRLVIQVNSMLCL